MLFRSRERVAFPQSAGQLLRDRIAQGTDRETLVEPQEKIDGFTPEQRFFLGWAQVWREVARPESLRFLTSSNEHAPAEWRVNGPLSNMPEFKAAWGCKADDRMVRRGAVVPRIW